MIDESIKVFIDTNVLIYAYSETEPEKKEKVLALLEQKAVCLSTQVINEFIWTMSKKFSIAMDLLKPATHNFFSMYEVFLLDEEAIVKAIELVEQRHFSYWDSLILSAALRTNCNILYTEDLQHGQVIDNKLTISNPFV